MIINKYDVPIKVLTPIHIGSNDFYNSKEYYYNKHESYRMNIIKLYNSLNTPNKEKFIKLFQDEKLSLNDILGLDIDELKKYSKYTVTNKYFEEPNYKREFESTIKSNNKPYIPGSSIKGFIKTALLYSTLDSFSVPKLMKKFNGEEGGDYWNIYENIFLSKMDESSLSNSIMRFLHISDSNSFEGNTHLYKVIRLYSPYKKAKYLRIMSVGERYVETIPESDLLKTTIVTNFDEKIFSELNFDEKIIKLLDISEIAKSLALFSEVIIDHEINFYSKHSRNDLAKKFQKLSKFNYYNKPLILLGSGTGFHAKTIYLKILDYDQHNGTDYSTEFCDILFKNRNNYIFPKTRRLLFPRYKPLGWAQLDLSNYIQKGRKNGT